MHSRLHPLCSLLFMTSLRQQKPFQQPLLWGCLLLRHSLKYRLYFALSDTCVRAQRQGRSFPLLTLVISTAYKSNFLKNWLYFCILYSEGRTPAEGAKMRSLLITILGVATFLSGSSAYALKSGFNVRRKVGKK